MLEPADHPKEGMRLSILRDTGLFRNEQEAEYEKFVAIASAIAGTPIALISLIDERRQWFKAKIGLNVSETPRNVSFCGHAILQDSGQMVVEDTTKDARFADNPLVTGDPDIRFYAGIPIRLGSRHLPIGTICVIDKQPRRLTPDQLSGLIALGELLEIFIDQKIRLTNAPVAQPVRPVAKPAAKPGA